MCHKWRSYDVWLLRYKTGHIFSLLLLFYPNNPENQNFEKMKKKRGDIIISHKYTKNHNHMLYCSSDMMHDGCNCYFSLWAVFCPFNPTPNSPKIPYQKKEEKKHLDISSFYTSVPKIMIRLCTAPEIRCVTDKHTGR